MKLTHYSNACCKYSYKNTSIICDPWLYNGAFEGSWYNFPKTKLTVDIVNNCDAIYISHLHPDHFDRKLIEQVRKDIDIIIIDSKDMGVNFLERTIKSLGFTNIVSCRDFNSIKYRDFKITVFKPFAPHPGDFHESKIGNLLDSALLVSAGGFTVLNTNDNTMDENSCLRFKAHFGSPTMVQLNYNAAGPYPSCFNNLSEEEKYLESNRIVERNISHLIKCASILEPKYVMPFAGNFVLGGKESYKNKYAGTISEYEASKRVKSEKWKVIILNSGKTFNFKKPEDHPRYILPTKEDYQKFIENITADLYPYECKQLQFSNDEIVDFLKASRLKMWQYQERFNCFYNYSLYIEIGQDSFFHIDLENKMTKLTSKVEDDEDYMVISMDRNLLYLILKNDIHWNNAETGFHINFHRFPNKYIPDIHWLLCFLHT